MKNQRSPEVIKSAVSEMLAELATKKVEANAFFEELDATSPEDVVDNEFSEGGDSPFDEGGEGGEGGEFGEGGEGGEFGEKQKKPKVETPEEAKKVLDEAKEDLQSVIDGIGEVMGEGEKEEAVAKMKRFNDRYAAKLTTLSKKAEKVIKDANDAMRHWAFLKHRKSASISNIKDNRIREAAGVLKDASSLLTLAKKLFGGKKVEATAVPPTGAEFSGDKWPNGKDPKMIEERAWKRQNTKFNSDVKHENARPNPAVDNRLNTVDYPRDESPFVNASFKFNTESPYDSYWDILDTKTGRRLHASFLNAPDKLGKKSHKGLYTFGSEEYGRRIVNNVILQELKKEAKKTDVSGIDFIKSEMRGEDVSVRTAWENDCDCGEPDCEKCKKNKKTSSRVEARDPKVKDKASIRRYYADAYGSSEYARELTSKDKAGRRIKKKSGDSPATEGMDIEYSPKDEHVADTNKGEDEPGEAKNGPNPISSKTEDQTALKAKVAKAVEVARIYASRGAIPFTKKAVYAKAKALLQMKDEEFGMRKTTLEELPITNEAALKEAHIPDTENGIVGNPAEGVRDPKSSVKTDNIDESVKGDAKVSKSAVVVPQMTVEASSQGKGEIPFTTTANRLKRKGVDINNLNIRRPSYRR